MAYSPEYLEIWNSLYFEDDDKRNLYSYQSFQGRDRKRQTDELFWRNNNTVGIDLSGIGFVINNNTGELEIVFDGTGNNPIDIFRWHTFTDGTTSVSAESGADTFEFEGTGTATVTVDAVNKKLTINASGGGLWTEDIGNGYLYPNTLTHDVGIKNNTPEEALHVTGNIKLSSLFGPNFIFDAGLTHEPFINYNDNISSELSIGSNSKSGIQIQADTANVGIGGSGTASAASSTAVFRIEEVLARTSTSYNTVEIVSDNTQKSKEILKIENTDTSNAFVMGVRHNGQIHNDFYGTSAAAATNLDRIVGTNSSGFFNTLAFDMGTAYTQTNGSGEITISHGLGVTPSVILLTKQHEIGAPVHAQTYGESVEIKRNSETSTQFVVRIHSTFGGAPVSNETRKVHYLCWA